MKSTAAICDDRFTSTPDVQFLSTNVRFGSKPVHLIRFWP